MSRYSPHKMLVVRGMIQGIKAIKKVAHAHNILLLFSLWNVSYYFLLIFNLEIDECVENTDGCHHSCTNTAGSYTCSCNEGYTLTANGRTCTGNTGTPGELLATPRNNAVLMIGFADLDECQAGTSLCEQNCGNTAGSYTCSCNAGYTLSSNGFTCISK